MSESSSIEPRLSLPLLAAADAPPATWHGWQLAAPLDAPEPVAPQGAYNAVLPEMPLVLPELSVPPASRRVELLAPAGGPEAGFAAFTYGADAIYLGLKKFSARAEAENFTLEEVDEITAYAHSLEPPRRVFVTINTLIRQDELPELVEAVAHLADIGVDALIVQDLGVYHLVRGHFPGLELHASTQLSVHNGSGASTLHRLGFRRVVLARELTFEEVADVTATSGIETEVFIHGALCYAYSGLCLFSSQTLGRSGNRGKCAYSCRDSYEVEGAPQTLRDGAPVRRDPAQGFPFSMKDLALPDHIPALRAAGVSCFKIEGRKKSPLYVATTTDYYRRLIDGRLAPEERPQLEADMQTVFSRPWTRLFVQSHQDKEVADRDTVGHRGTRIGTVEAVLGGDEPRLRFRTVRALERHDGLQIDLPVLGKPFGFAVERLWIVSPGRKGRREEAFQAPAGARVEVSLPRDHPPLPEGAPVYCSSSQAVKQKYRHSRPRPGVYRSRRRIAVTLTLTAEALTAVARTLPETGDAVEVRRELPGPFPPARDAAAMNDAVRAAFDKLGATHLELAELTFHKDPRFVPVSRLNALRRDLTADIEQALHAALAGRIDRLREELGRCATGGLPASVFSGVRATGGLPASASSDTRTEKTADTGGQAASGTGRGFRWSIKVDRIGFLDALEERDLADVDEIVIDIARDHPTLLEEKLGQWAARVGRERLRLALPALTRRWEEKGLVHKVRRLRQAGWRNWEASNLSAWAYLDLDPLQRTTQIDLATDWSVYVLNRLAAQQLIEMGVTRFALSPEDGIANVGSLLSEFGPRAVVIVYQDTPLFVAESCAYANLIGGCPGKANCRFESMEMASSHGEKVTALDYHCRTIVLNLGPFCLAERLPDLAAAGAISLRADFVYRNYNPTDMAARWRLVRAGRPVPGGHAANFDRGVL
jgi:putative protease